MSCPTDTSAGRRLDLRAARTRGFRESGIPRRDRLALRCLGALAIAAQIVAIGCHATVPETPTHVAVLAPRSPAQDPVPLPHQKGSLRFAVIGDFGSGERPEYQLAEQVAKAHKDLQFDFVITVGDNLYGMERPQDFKLKFEDPYKALLDDKVKFYACLGNHDSREQRYYKLFNMDGNLYYSFKAPKEAVRFFALDSTYPVPEQIDWLEKELKGSNEPWKIAYFHHPLYSSGEAHGSDVKLRETLEPLFLKYDVSVVLSGHDHFYERIKPQQGIAYFVTGSAGQLRIGNIKKNSPLTAVGFDTDLAFMAVEIVDDKMYFHAISRQGEIVDSGIIERRKAPKETTAG